MIHWELTILAGLIGLAIGYLRSIFQELRSIRRMMNADRRISNEVQTFDD